MRGVPHQFVLVPSGRTAVASPASPVWNGPDVHAHLGVPLEAFPPSTFATLFPTIIYIFNWNFMWKANSCKLLENYTVKKKTRLNFQTFKNEVVCPGVLHLETGICAHFSFAKRLRLSMIRRDVCDGSLRILPQVLGQILVLALWSGSLSCWKVNPDSGSPCPSALGTAFTAMCRLLQHLCFPH